MRYASDASAAARPRPATQTFEEQIRMRESPGSAKTAAEAAAAAAAGGAADTTLLAAANMEAGLEHLGAAAAAAAASQQQDNGVLHELPDPMGQHLQRLETELAALVSQCNTRVQQQQQQQQDQELEQQQQQRSQQLLNMFMERVVTVMEQQVAEYDGGPPGCAEFTGVFR
jgi:hypothetical protein